MNKDKKLLHAFEKFNSLRRETSDGFVRDRILRHKDYVLPVLDAARSIVFRSMAEDFTHGLIGEVNRFLVNIQHADCWVRVANEYDINDRRDLVWEFADPLLELSVARPYSLRNNFIFAIVHLAHQANSRKKAKWHDDLPPDSRINYKVLAKVGGDWKLFPQFLRSLEDLNATSFKKQETRNFRHLHEHRFRLPFDTGFTTNFERIEQNGRVTYSFKAIPALQPKTLIPALYEQHKNSTEVFKSYWQLLNEFCAVWKG